MSRTLYAIIGIVKIKDCQNCLSHNCHYCRKYGKFDEIIKFFYTNEIREATTKQLFLMRHNQEIPSDLKTMPNVQITYQMHKFRHIEEKEREIITNPSQYFFGILETVYSIDGKSILWEEIIFYDFSFHNVRKTYNQILLGKSRIHGNFNFDTYNYFPTYQMIKLSNKLC